MNLSMEVSKIAIKLAISTREEEAVIKAEFKKNMGQAVAMDIGGKMPESTAKIIERIILASKKNGVIDDHHVHDGALAGAAREAIIQISIKTNGFNSGGKIAVARQGEHLSVAIFMSVGLLNLNDIVIGLSHRAIPAY